MKVIASTPTTTTLQRTCPFCGNSHTYTFQMSVDELNNKTIEWSCGALIQQVFPNVDADGREFLKTGICPRCWASL